MILFKKIPINACKQSLLKDFNTVQKHWITHFNTEFYNGDWSGIPLRSPAVKSHPLSAGMGFEDEFVDESLFSKLTYTRDITKRIYTEKLSIRYLRLTPGSEIKLHADHDMIFWDGLVRLHIPVLTNNKVLFEVNNELVNMQAGECWFADFSKPHRVYNGGDTDRIHLVIDCKVNTWLKDLFIKEGIICKNEQKPDPISNYTEEEKEALIKSLLEINSETALEMARNLSMRYNIPLPF